MLGGGEGMGRAKDRVSTTICCDRFVLIPDRVGQPSKKRRGRNTPTSIILNVIITIASRLRSQSIRPEELEGHGIASPGQNHMVSYTFHSIQNNSPTPRLFGLSACTLGSHVRRQLRAQNFDLHVV